MPHSYRPLWIVLLAAAGGLAASEGCGGLVTVSHEAPPVCGNGIVEVGESCDDGNNDENDGCTNVCSRPPDESFGTEAGGGAGKLCGNGILNPGELCDDGNAINDDQCTNACTSAACGDGIVQKGEACDDGDKNGSAGSACSSNCQPASMSSSSTGCLPQDPSIYVGTVTNNNDPMTPGAGIPSKWTYSGLEGFAAGTAMCAAIGADHVCDYEEIVQAEAAGELVKLPTTSYWLHRTTTVPNITKNVSCTMDSDCAGGTGTPFCDPQLKKCGWKAGAWGRCNDWTYPTDHISDGEWFEKATANSDKSAVVIGSLAYHIDGVVSPDGNFCKQSDKPGCAGGCGSGGLRGIACCRTPMKCP